jgi:hypothetical protein
MAKAPQSYHKISDLIRDPVLRSVWRCAESEFHQTFCPPDEPAALQPALPRHAPQVLDGGAAAERELEEVS